MIESTDPTLLSASLRMLWGLLIVCGILLVLYGIMRKRLSFVQSNKNSKIQVKEIRHLMPKKSICLVEVDGQEYLLGLGADNITLLASLDEKKASTFDARLAAAETDEHS